jgi:putative NADH-flavin reductase
MKIVIFGATGQTGKLLVEQALARGHHVTAYVRTASKLLLGHPNLNIIEGALNNTSQLKLAIQGADACISALGGNSLTRRSAEIPAGIDHIANIMEQEGVQRFIYLSSIGAGESRFYMGPVLRFLITDLMLRVPLADHNLNEQRLMKSSLQWSIVRPGSLTNGPLTGQFKHGSEKIELKGNLKISRANVASFMLDQVSGIDNINKAIWLFE